MADYQEAFPESQLTPEEIQQVYSGEDDDWGEDDEYGEAGESERQPTAGGPGASSSAFDGATRSRWGQGADDDVHVEGWDFVRDESDMQIPKSTDQQIQS